MEQTTAYRMHDGIAQSDIKMFRKNRTEFFESKILKLAIDKQTSKSLTMGDTVDMLALTPERESEYLVIEMVDPSPDMKLIMDNAFHSRCAVLRTLKDTEVPISEEDESNFFTFEQSKDQLISAARAQNYQSKYGDEALYTALTKFGKGYFESLVLQQGRTIISGNTYRKARKSTDKLFQDPAIAILFNQPGVRIIKQQDFYGVYNGMVQKILIDLGHVDDKNKIVYPFDLKSCFQMKQFMISYYERGYGYQGSFYTDVLAQNFPGYTIAPFKFIAVSTETDEKPMIYRMSNGDLELYKSGGVTSRGFKIIGWQQTMDEIKWHMSANKWDYPKSYYETGELVISSTDSAEADFENDDIL